MGKKTARAVVFDQTGRLLMMERHKDGDHYFVLPGGHVKDGEAPEQAAMREVLEETGLRVTVKKLLYTSTDDKFRNDQRIFLCEYHGGEPALPSDSIEYRVQQSGEPQTWQPGWFAFDQLKEKTVYPNGLIRYIQEDQAINYHHNPYKILERPSIIEQ